jgi:tetratricopeptide (TPR) repeat protein
MTALDLLMSGRFDEAIAAYRQALAINPDDLGSLDGLASALMNAGQYEEAIPLKMRLHECDKAENAGHPGQHLYLAAAYWCLEDRARAIEFAHGLCAAILDSSVTMAPDHAGGATFGLFLHYMAVTAGDNVNRDYALNFLQKLNVRYDKRPSMFRYPVATVKQLLGEASFEEALVSATGEHNLAAAYHKANESRSVMLRLGTALFHDGAIRRSNGDESACITRMQQVFALGYQTEPLCWSLSRHEAESFSTLKG